MADRQALIARLTTSIAAGDPPDLFLINYRFFGQFAARGVLEPLQARLDASDVLAEDEMYDLALDAFRDSDGDLTCLPQNVSSLVVYYNRDLFEAAGVPEPAAGLDVGRHDGGGRGAARRATSTGWASRRRSSGWRPFVWSNGGEHRRRPGATRPGSRSTPPRRSRRWSGSSPSRADGLIPTAEESAAEDDEARFANGRLAMYLQLAAGHAAVPPDHRLRVGRRPAAGARRSRPACCTPTPTA